MRLFKTAFQIFPTKSVATNRTTTPTNRTNQIAMLTLGSLLLAYTGALAQVDRGQIAGVVTDQSGAVVAGATVTVKNIASNAERSTQSSETGAYTLVGLTPGTYSVSVAAAQFKPFSASVEITVGGH